MERPFSEEDVLAIRDVTEWLFEGSSFEPGEELPDGTDPSALIEAWAPWVKEAVMFMDGDGAVRHFKYGVVYAEEPAFDCTIYEHIRSRWIPLVNEKRKR